MMKLTIQKNQPKFEISKTEERLKGSGGGTQLAGGGMSIDEGVVDWLVQGRGS